MEMAFRNNFLYFHAFLGTFVPNNKLVPLHFGVDAPFPWEILDPPDMNVINSDNNRCCISMKNCGQMLFLVLCSVMMT